MRKIIFLFLITSLCAQIKFDNYFFNKTMRFDYIHAGNHSTSLYYFNKIKEEPYWGGSKINLLDTLNLGDYFFKVVDSLSGREIYSKGYSSLFYEWQTTDEANKINKSMEESLIFPFPKKPVILEIYERDTLNNFEKVFSFNIDPASYFIMNENDSKYEKFAFHYSGDPAANYDLVFLPEGYSESDSAKFRTDSENLISYLFEFEPFKAYSDKINIWGVKAFPKDSGVDIPKDSVWKNTLMDFTYYTFDSERYLMTENYQKVRDIAANAPYDNIYVIVNSEKYGGGAIYNFYCAVAAGNKMAKEVFVHEFGHGLAGLADEYYTSEVSYENYFSPDVEPWQVNITTMVNFNSKWKNDIQEGIPVPTPDDDKYNNVLGAFEGGGYVANGVYRPTRNSIMKTLSEKSFNLPSIKIIKRILNLSSQKAGKQ